MSECFPEPRSSGGRVKVELDLFNYATEADLENATGDDTSKFAKKFDLASLKSEVYKLENDELEKVPTGLNNLESKVDKLDTGKLETTPVDLGKLSNVIENDAVKKIELMNWLKKVNALQTSDTCNLVKKTDYNTKINETEKNLLIMIIILSILLH